MPRLRVPASLPFGAGAFPLLFVLLWSTGFIAAKYGLPYAPPLSFLAFRFVLVAVLVGLFATVTGAPRPHSWREIAHSAFAGWLVHGLYLGGVFVALADGMPAGTIAMLVGLQPLLTVLIARAWLGERVTLRQWSGLLLGLAGVWLVVRHKIALDANLAALAPAGIALAGISVGTLWQKRHCAHLDLRTGAVIQFAACALLYAPVVAWLDAPAVRWTASFVFALGWSVLVLSLGAISLLYWLLRHGAAADVARLFYLVPMVTALMAWGLFGETLDPPALAGMVVIAVAVALARPRPPGPTPATPPPSGDAAAPPASGTGGVV